jgi:4-oxalocrotonate tautomerase
MPTLHLQLSRPQLDEDRAMLAQRLTRLTAEVLGKRSVVTAVLVDVLPAGHWFIGGEAVAASTPMPGTARLSIDITQGTNTPAQKEAFVQAAWALLNELLGPLAEASYIIVRELPAEDWGYGGRTQAARRVGASPSARLSVGVP